MVNLQAVKANNASLSSLAPGLVAVFVGGTSGIGLSTAREFVRNTKSPHVYLVGRNQEQANAIISEFSQLNPSSETNFIKSDVSLLRSVDDVCRDIQAKEKKVNLLFMTAGYVTFKGREETSEGLDRKFSLHYYARMRFVSNLLPQLTAAANSPDKSSSLSRVVSVLDPHAAVNFGGAGTLVSSDLSLKNNFTLKNCAAHASIMMNFFLEHQAKAHPDTAFVHAYPSTVNTNAARGLGPVLTKVWAVTAVLAKPFMVDLKESGERHLYASTAPEFAPRKEESVSAVTGGEGAKGSGSYWLNWDGETLSANKKLEKLRKEGVEDVVVKHTEEVFKQVCEEGKTYP